MFSQFVPSVSSSPETDISRCCSEARDETAEWSGADRSRAVGTIGLGATVVSFREELAGSETIGGFTGETDAGLGGGGGAEEVREIDTAGGIGGFCADSVSGSDLVDVGLT